MGVVYHLTGKILFVGDKFVVLDVSGVGYKINVGLDAMKWAAKSHGETASFWTHLAVREDALDLYGFKEKAELEFFELLINVPSVGPRTALAVLNLASLDSIRAAISSGDATYLTKVSGIGRKTAEKIVLELKDKFSAAENGAWQTSLKEESEAIEALEALGYSAKEAREAIKKVPKEIIMPKQKIKEALKILGRAS